MLGNVFRNVPGGQLIPCYSYGPKGESKNRTPMLTCPVYAIPDQIFEVLKLYHECRVFGIAPRAGGVEDQPWLARKAFPVFAAEMDKITMRRDYHIAEQASMAGGAAASMTVMKALFGKGK